MAAKLFVQKPGLATGNAKDEVMSTAAEGLAADMAAWSIPG
jgi:hypothetical protein